MSAKTQAECHEAWKKAKCAFLETIRSIDCETPGRTAHKARLDRHSGAGGKNGRLECATPVEEPSWWVEMMQIQRIVTNAERHLKSTISPDLLAACKRCLPDWVPDEDDADGQICCELTNGDVRALLAAIAKAEEKS